MDTGVITIIVVQRSTVRQPQICFSGFDHMDNLNNDLLVGLGSERSRKA